MRLHINCNYLQLTRLMQLISAGARVRADQGMMDDVGAGSLDPGTTSVVLLSFLLCIFLLLSVCIPKKNRINPSPCLMLKLLPRDQPSHHKR
jgi:hypothetical protein